MKTPDKIYIAFENGFVAQTANTDKDAEGNSVFVDGLEPVEYIRKDALLEWANGMSKAVATLGEELAYNELIEHIKSL